MSGVHLGIWGSSLAKVYQIAFVQTSTSGLHTYMWLPGFGSKYTGGPSYSSGYTADFNTAGNAVALGRISANPVFVVFAWSSAGYGAKFADPAIAPAGAAYGNVAFNKLDSAIAVAHQTTPNVTAYPWSSSGFGSKYANLSPALSTTNAQWVDFRPQNDAIAIGYGDTPSLRVHAWSSSGFGAKFADPTSWSDMSTYQVKFSPSGSVLAVGAFNNGVQAWPWSSSGFGTRYANPNPASGNNQGIDFSPSENAVIMAGGESINLSAYAWSPSGFGTKYANMSPLPNSWFYGTGAAFAPDGKSVAVSHDNFGNSGALGITAYPWNPGFGTAYAQPSGLTGRVEDVTFAAN